MLAVVVEIEAAVDLNDGKIDGQMVSVNISSSETVPPSLPTGVGGRASSCSAPFSRSE